MIRLLDCTLRDGGYLNNWTFGHDNIIAIFERLVSAQIDIIEIGFLDAGYNFDINKTIQANSNALSSIYRNVDTGDAIIVGMIDYGACPIENIQPCRDTIMDGIRIIFKKEKMHDAIAYCKEVKELGYQVFAQAVSITSYSDEELDELLELVNDLNPYAFSLVDTYGLLHKGRLMHYFERADQKLNAGIGLGYHSHNNFQLGYANCIELIEEAADRDLIIDGSLYGMGKSAGNTPIELLASYMNERTEKKYEVYQLLEAIDGIILDMRKVYTWGYSFRHFLSASQDCHPEYVAYLTEKKKLSVKSISEILDGIKKEKKLNYDEAYIESKYIEYQKSEHNDRDDCKNFQREISNRRILLIGPGTSIKTQSDKVLSYIQKERPYIISVNFLSDSYESDAIFISNAKRYVGLSTKLQQYKKRNIIATSNITETSKKFQFMVSYEKYLDEEARIADNPMIMIIKLLLSVGIKDIALAGFDGYVKGNMGNYAVPEMEQNFIRENADIINQDVIKSLCRLETNCKLNYITDSLYDRDRNRA